MCLPLGDYMNMWSILLDCLSCILFYLFKIFQLLLILLIDVLEVFTSDKALEALILLQLAREEGRRGAMRITINTQS